MKMQRILFGSVLLAYAVSAKAAIEYSTFTDIYDNQHTPVITIDKTSIINNASTLDIMISAGLDRRINVSLMDLNAEVLFESTSHVISINDKLVIGNKQFYGISSSVPIANDGQYQLKIKTISLNGEVVNTEIFNINRDTTPPLAGEVTKSLYGGFTNEFTSDDVWSTGYYSRNYFQINDVSDESSGVESVSIVSYIMSNDTANEYKIRALPFDNETKLARFNFNTDYSLWPTGDNAETLYGFNFRIKDKAGNIFNSPIQKMYYDTVGAVGLQLVGVRNPNSTNTMAGRIGYDPYVSGMTVYENPISVMYKIPKDQHINYVRGGYGPVGSSEQITDHDDDYVYAIFTRSYGFKDGNYLRFRDRRSWTIAGFGYNLALSPNAPKSPVRVGRAEYLYSDIGWSSWSRWHIQVDQLPLQILGSRQRVQPRSYEQRWSHHLGSCVIPVGSDICEVIYSTPIELAVGSSGYYHHGSSINSTDNTLIGPPGWADVSYNSEHSPEFKSSYLEGSTLHANIHQPGAGWWFDQLRIRDVWLENQQGTRLSATQILKRNGADYEAQWDLTTLPEGEYTLIAKAREMHGLTAQLEETYNFVNDKTPPKLKLGYENNFDVVPEVISELRDLKITLNDNISPVFLSELKLKSQDDEINVNLGYSLLRESNEGKTKIYTPELPRLFPSLVDGKRYKIIINARDKFDNEVMIEKSFSFIPSNLIVMDTQTTLPINTEIKDAENNNITYIYSNEDLVLEDGRNATGLQDAIITVNELATYSIKVNNELINPGESKQLAIDLGDAGGKLNVPIIPQLAGADNEKIEVMFEIPSLKSKYD